MISPTNRGEDRTPELSDHQIEAAVGEAIDRHENREFIAPTTVELETIATALDGFEVVIDQLMKPYNFVALLFVSCDSRCGRQCRAHR